MRIVLRNVAVVTEGTSVAENVDLHINDTKICSITKEDLSTTECDVLIDGTGKLAIPGLINAHNHLAETLSETRWCQEQKGVTPVGYLNRIGAFSVPTLAVHCVYVNSDDMRLLAERKVKVVHCPKSNAKLASRSSPVSMMLRSGVTIALGTDGAASNNSLNMIEEMRMAALFGKRTCPGPNRAVSSGGIPNGDSEWCFCFE